MNTISGVLTEDPAVNLPSGSKLFFGPTQMLVDTATKNGLSTLVDVSALDGLLLTIHFKRSNNDYVIGGSGVMVAPGVAIGVMHVIDARIQELLNGGSKVSCITITREGLQFWDLKIISHIKNSDLIICP